MEEDSAEVEASAEAEASAEEEASEGADFIRHHTEAAASFSRYSGEADVSEPC